MLEAKITRNVNLLLTYIDTPHVSFASISLQLSATEFSIFRAMPALAPIDAGTPFFEVPENALRVLLTGYGVSLYLHPSLFAAECLHKVSPPRDILTTRHGSLSRRSTMLFYLWK